MAAPDYSHFPKPKTQAEIDAMEGVTPEVEDSNPLHINVTVRTVACALAHIHIYITIYI